MKYEFVPGYIRITDKPTESSCLIHNDLTGNQYRASLSMGAFLSELNGRNDPFDIAERMWQMSIYETEKMLCSLIDDGIVREVVTELYDEDNTRMIALWKSKNGFTSKTIRAIAIVLKVILMIAIIPINLAAACLYFTNPVEESSINMAWVLSIIFSTVIGLAAHETGHAVTAIAANIPVYEAGVILIKNFIPGAYVFIDDKECDKQIVRAGIYGAGVMVNFVLGAIFICIGTSVQSPNLILMAGTQYALAISNLAPIESLDGAEVLRSLTNGIDFPSIANKICGNKPMIKKLINNKGRDGALLIGFAYCIRAAQISLFVAGAFAIALL